MGDYVMFQYTFLGGFLLICIHIQILVVHHVHTYLSAALVEYPDTLQAYLWLMCTVGIYMFHVMLSIVGEWEQTPPSRLYVCA